MNFKIERRFGKNEGKIEVHFDSAVKAYDPAVDGKQHICAACA